jgi:hypothetical protein
VAAHVELDGEQLELLIADAYLAGYGRAVEDFRAHCLAPPAPSAGRRFLRLVLAVGGLRG